MKTRASGAIFAWCAVLCAAASLRADEIKLKDGSKIVGTVVAIEDGSYKIKTSYGYAMVEKDKIAAIIPSGGTAEKTAKNAVDSDKEKRSANENVNSTRAIEVSSAPAGDASKTGQPAAAQPATVSAAAASSEPQPAPKPAPEPIHESVDGTLYVNQTFGFRLYKPPSWELIPDARAALESAVAALGTFDETTLMVIAREPLQGTLEKHASTTQQRVSTAYENFRITGTRAGIVAGLPTNERHYRGVIDGHDWSGVIVTFGRGSDVYTILGATRAETDLVQIQENVIARTIASLQFDPAGAARQ